MEWAFFALLWSCVHTYLLFPAVMALVVLFEREPRGGAAPSLTVLIPARNEAARIRAKIENTLASDYPADRLHVLVGSDGSVDGTADVVRTFGDPRVRVMEWAPTAGKSLAVNRLLSAVETDVVAVSDADVLIDRDALRRLARHLDDPRVGAVCARRADRVPEGGVRNGAQHLHNRYESWIKRGEGVLGRVLGGDGALYVIRRECLQPIPPHVPDDFVAVLRVLLSGRRVAYENGAVAREELPAHPVGLLTRRRRTVARGIRGLWAVRGLLNPLRFPLTALLLVSHRVLRWFAGFAMVGLLLVNVALCGGRPFFQVTLALQALFYLGSGVACCLLPGVGGRWRRVGSYFILSNIGAVAGVCDVLARREWARWDVQREDGAA